jgi:hypothetical protein
MAGRIPMFAPASQSAEFLVAIESAIAKDSNARVFVSAPAQGLRSTESADTNTDRPKALVVAFLEPGQCLAIARHQRNRVALLQPEYGRLDLHNGDRLVSGPARQLWWRPAEPSGDDGSASEQKVFEWLRESEASATSYAHFTMQESQRSIERAADWKATRCRAARTAKNRAGPPGVEISKALADELGVSENDTVCVWRERGSIDGPSTVSAPAIVRLHESTSAGSIKQADLDADTTRLHECGLDQSLRVALGIDAGESFNINAVTPRGKGATSGTSFTSLHERESPVGALRRLLGRLSRWLLPTLHVLARVQPAEMTLTEQRASVLPQLVLDALGVESGSELVLRSVVPPENRNKEAKSYAAVVKAYVATSDIIDRRNRIYGGSAASGLPSEENVLGVSAALPWIWLDDASRRRLRLPNGGLQVVRVRPHRTFVVLDILRDSIGGLLVTLLLACAGLLADGPGTRIIIYVAVPIALLATFGVAVWRAKVRLR